MTIPPITEFEFQNAYPPRPSAKVEAGEQARSEIASVQRNELPPPIMDIADETKERLLVWLDQWLLDLESAMSDKDMDWADQERAYRALTPGAIEFEPFKGSSRDIIPVGAMAVDPIHARLDIGIFKQDPVFTFKGLRKDILPMIPSIQAFVDKYTKNYLKLRKVASPRILECAKLGTMAFKTVYDRDEYEVLKYNKDFSKIEKVREIRYAGPRVFGVHLGDLLFPPFYEDVQDCPIIMERQRTTYEALKVLEAGGKLANVDKVKNQQTIGIRTRVEEARENASKHVLRTTFANEIIVHEAWCDFDIDGDGIPEHLVITYHHDSRTILQLRLNWYFHQRKPYTIIPYTVANDTMYGLGVMEMVKPLQDAITKWHRMAQDNAYSRGTCSIPLFLRTINIRMFARTAG